MGIDWVQGKTLGILGDWCSKQLSKFFNRTEYKRSIDSSLVNLFHDEGIIDRLSKITVIDILNTNLFIINYNY